jgi:hypothetical protein
MNTHDSKGKSQYNKGDMTYVEDEVKKLFRKNNGKITTADFMKLRHKYDDNELVDKIQGMYVEKHNIITKKAKKFAQLIREKYSNQQYPFHILLEKAKLYKIKHKLGDEEFAEFQRIYEQELVGLKSPDVMIVTTNMMKILGSINLDFHGFTSKLNDTDYKYLQEILKLYSLSRPLHAQVLLQSIQYNDCDYEALSGKFMKEHGHRPAESIHPVLAALFIPKIDILDTHFLHSNISGIVKARYNNEPLTTRPDFLLFDALVKDPNDVVCDNRSSVLDLLNRAQIQHQLWNCVLNLRNGQYYNQDFRNFITSIDICKLNKQDNPDLLYGRYDGTILKRLLSAFSFRPTIVSTSPIYNTVNMNPYQQNIKPVVTAVPMINLRLPLSLDDDNVISLQQALEQHQQFIENGFVTLKHTSLIFSRGVLFFFVDRRANVIRYNDYQPFNISRLPLSISGFERLNDREVDFDTVIKIRGDTYNLRSVVIAEVNKTAPEKNIIVGSSTIIMIHANPEKNIYQNEFLLYDPISVVEPVISDQPGQPSHLENRNPMSQIFEGPGLGVAGKSFQELARQRGVIFMYQLVETTSENELTY